MSLRRSRPLHSSELLMMAPVELPAEIPVRPFRGPRESMTGNFSPAPAVHIIPQGRPHSPVSDEAYMAIGIDFGTTYSGVAWAWSGEPDEVNIVTNWDSRLLRTAESAKAPTEIYYEDGEIYWGYDIPPEKEPLAWFKLLLLQNEDLQEDVRQSPFLQKAREMLLKSNKSAIQVVADYLRKLWEHTIDSIIRERGGPGVDGLPFRVVLTVPAIWKSYAQAKMREAAQLAGILDYRHCGDTRLELVTEPEAAALATLAEYKRRNDFNPGDVFVVCDCGGGTVDIISYKLRSMEPMLLQESVEGQGKLCGAIFVDEKFQAAIRGKLGNKNWSKLSQTSIKKLMNDEWEYGIKRVYNENNPNRKWTVNLPPEAIPRVSLNPTDKKGDVQRKHGFIELSQGHIRTYFNTVVGDIRALVDGQVEQVKNKEGKLPKAIVLVGGFGASNYLYRMLHEEHKDSIMVLQPRQDRPWTAICRGAVIKAGSNVVMSRVSRYHYGLSASHIFVEGTHDPRDKYWCKKELLHRANNQMEWYISRGADTQVEHPVSTTFSYFLDKPLPNNTLTYKIYYCNETKAPSRVDDAVYPLSTLSSKVDVSFENMPTWRNKNGEVFRKLKFEIQMTSNGASLEFAVLIDGRKQSQDSVEITFDEIPQGMR